MKRLKIFLAAMVLAMASLVALPSAPANAGPLCYTYAYCGYMFHGNDDGYDPAIIITCNWNTKAQTWLYEGHDSREFCQDMDGFWVRPGEELWCWNYAGIGYWYKRADDSDWYKITDAEHYRNCTLRQD